MFTASKRRFSVPPIKENVNLCTFQDQMRLYEAQKLYGLRSRERPIHLRTTVRGQGSTHPSAECLLEEKPKGEGCGILVLNCLNSNTEPPAPIGVQADTSLTVKKTG